MDHWAVANWGVVGLGLGVSGYLFGTRKTREASDHRMSSDESMGRSWCLRLHEGCSKSS